MTIEPRLVNKFHRFLGAECQNSNCADFFLLLVVFVFKDLAMDFNSWPSKYESDINLSQDGVEGGYHPLTISELIDR